MKKAMRATALAAVTALALAGGAAAQSSGKVLKFVPEADLRILDPITTTAYITRNHGYMIYDTLFALDKDFKVRPQMVDHWTVSDDKLTWTFTLRDGLKFHDGQPVEPADCIASLQRWSKRDVLGQSLGEDVASWDAVDGKTFTITLKKPFPLLLEAIGKLSSNVPFIMPERVAKTDPDTPITDATGSGPFKFVKEEWVPGNKVVYVKNADYVPRKEPPSWAAGGKMVNVDRVEWIYIPDATTVVNALQAGEVDWMQQLPSDFVTLVRQNKDVTITNVDPLGSIGVLRFNHLQPPFNNPKLRQALLWAIDQKDYMTAVAADPKNWMTCFSYFTCDTPMASEIGAEPLKGNRDLAKVRQLIKDSGYKNERIVLMSATDQPIVHNQALVTGELLRQLGLNVDFQAMDWGTLITRRGSKAPVDKNGWSIFHTWFVGADMADPALSFALRGNGDRAWFGWPTNERIEKLRDEWIAAPDAEARKEIAGEIQTAAFEEVPYIPTGQFVIPTAYRKNLDGLIVAPVVFLWNVEKK
jgi:peptide/nickel transport system substrate-binding protein